MTEKQEKKVSKLKWLWEWKWVLIPILLLILFLLIVAIFGVSQEERDQRILDGPPILEGKVIDVQKVFKNKGYLYVSFEDGTEAMLKGLNHNISVNGRVAIWCEEVDGFLRTEKVCGIQIYDNILKIEDHWSYITDGWTVEIIPPP